MQQFYVTYSLHTPKSKYANFKQLLKQVILDRDKDDVVDMLLIRREKSSLHSTGFGTVSGTFI